MSLHYYKVHVHSILSESTVNISPGTPVKTTQTCIFLHMCTYPPSANSPHDLRGYATAT